MEKFSIFRHASCGEHMCTIASTLNRAVCISKLSHDVSKLAIYLWEWTILPWTDVKHRELLLCLLFSFSFIQVFDMTKLGLWQCYFLHLLWDYKFWVFGARIPKFTRKKHLKSMASKKQKNYMTIWTSKLSISHLSERWRSLILRTYFIHPLNKGRFEEPYHPIHKIFQVIALACAPAVLDSKWTSWKTCLRFKKRIYSFFFHMKRYPL